LKLRVQ